MRFRFIAVVGLLLATFTALWAKPLDPNAIMLQSDAQYYYPANKGVNDIAVDISIERLAKDPALKDMSVTYLYAGLDKQKFVISGIPDEKAKLRDELLAFVTPLGEYVMPPASSASFKGFNVKAKEVTRQIVGLPGTKYIQLVGKNSDDKAPMQELRILLDKQGLAHQVENVFADKSVVTARLENTRIGDFWQITRITTRLIVSKDAYIWKIDDVTYSDIQGFSMPTRITTHYFDSHMQSIKSIGSQPISDEVINLTNYRINVGAAAAALTTEPAPPTAQ